jgi:putative NIF3 family GTP cyclohydrolase 1 type 2
MGHHEILDASSRGIATVLCDHSNTERGFLRVLKGKLADMLEGKVDIVVSEVDSDPLVVV